LFTYRYVGEARVLIADLNREVSPGEEFESPIELNGASFEVVAIPDPEKVA
jgi:hypothetical protein